MRNFQQKRVWRNIFQSKPFLIFLGILILLFTWNIWGMWNKMEDTVKNKKIEEDKIAQLEQQKEKLSADINDLNTDQGKEKIFRENFGLAKEGEGEIVVLDDNSTPPTTSPAPTGFLSFIRNLFK
jgi:cell division protein FtsB